MDLGRHPFLAADIASVEGGDASWMIKLTWDRNGDGQVSGGEDDLALSPESPTGLSRWNIAELTGLTGRHTFAKLQLHVLGEGARTVWQSVRFVSQDGDAPDEGEPQPLTDLGLPVVHDLRGRFGDSVSAYEWALRELMLRCNRRYAHAAGGPCEGAKV